MVRQIKVGINRAKKILKVNQCSHLTNGLFFSFTHILHRFDSSLPLLSHTLCLPPSERKIWHLSLPALEDHAVNNFWSARILLHSLLELIISSPSIARIIRLKMSATKDSKAVDNFLPGTVSSVSGPRALPPLKLVQRKRR